MNNQFIQETKKNNQIKELHQWMIDNKVGKGLNNTQLIKIQKVMGGLSNSNADFKLTNLNAITANVSCIQFYNLTENLVGHQINIKKVSRLRLREEYIKFKPRARKVLGLGIYVPLTYIHYFSTQLRKVVGKRTRLSSIRRRQNLLKGILTLNQKLNVLRNLKNSIQNINNKIILKNNKYITKEVNLNSLPLTGKKTLQNLVNLPDYLTENSNWKRILLHKVETCHLPLPTLWSGVEKNKSLDNITINDKISKTSNSLGNNISSIKTVKRLINKQENKLNNITRGYHSSNLTSIQINNVKSESILVNNNIPKLNNDKLKNKINKMSIDRSVKANNNINSLTKFYSEEANSQYLLFLFSNKNKNKYSFKIAENLLKVAFLSMGCLISKPIFSLVYDQKSEDSENYFSKPQSKIIIRLFYFFKKTGIKRRKRSYRNIHLNRLNIDILAKYKLNLQFLVDRLAKIFKSEIKLELVELKKPHYNSNILAQYLGLKSYKYRFVKLIKKLFRRVNIEKPSNIFSFSQGPKGSASHSKLYLFPSFLAGIRIRLGGRTFKQKIIPRRTVQYIQKGSLNRNNVNFIEKARFTGKTRRGSYSFTVTLGHVL